MIIKFSDIETITNKSFIKCKYVAKDGSVIIERYYHTSLCESIRNFKTLLKRL